MCVIDGLGIRQFHGTFPHVNEVTVHFVGDTVPLPQLSGLWSCRRIRK